MGSRGRGRKQLLDKRKERRGYCKLKEEALDCYCGGIALDGAIDLFLRYK
jgi:hypothetical protein